MESFRIENLTFTYPKKDAPQLLDISLCIEQGEFVVLAGKSGSGKTTLLRQLKPVLSLHGEKSGSVYFEGKEISTLSHEEESRKIGFVMQNPDSQIVTDKVWHELAFGLESLSYSTEEIRVRVAEMASFFGIGTWFHKNVNELSGGQKQLLNLASVMAMGPSVLVLDEPTSQLDPIAALDFLETVSKINRELGTTVILTEHRLEDALAFADRVVVLDEGRIIADGAPSKAGELLKHRGHEMFEAFPVPMRVFGAVPNNLPCPVTIRDGRKWLDEMAKENALLKESFIKDKRTADNSDVVIEIKDAYFKYKKDAPDVISGLSLKVKKGELYAILGPNGIGKTTALSLILGILKPQSGHITVKSERVSMLVQSPQALFVKKTLMLDLLEALSCKKMSLEEKERLILKTSKLCKVSHLLSSHPYDLSGGEQQRAALAKLLLTQPEVLLLDEPTKGLDASFKKEFAEILNSLLENGVTVLMVSHDIEFCAKYADRCAMFFDGCIVSENEPRKFFAGKSFYTTAANRMARAHLPNAILAEDIILSLGGTLPQKEDKQEKDDEVNFNKIEEKPKKKQKNLVLSLVFFALFLALELIFYKKFDDWRNYLIQVIGLWFLGMSFTGFFPQRVLDDDRYKSKQKKLTKRTLLACFLILILIPVTIFFGIRYLDDRKYFLISLLIILETSLPFIWVFEKRKPKAREIVIISVLCAIAVLGRAAFFMLPEFKPVIALVIISGVCFGGESGFLVGAVTGFVSNFFFGQGPLTPWQMFAFGIIGFLAGVLFQKGLIKKTKSALCTFGVLATVLVYGGIMNPASVIVWQPNPSLDMILAAYKLGIPFDVIHGVATAFFLWFISAPMIEKLDRIKIKYGLIEER